MAAIFRKKLFSGESEEVAGVTKNKERKEDHLLSLKEVTNNEPLNSMSKAYWLWPGEGLQRLK